MFQIRVDTSPLTRELVALGPAPDQTVGAVPCAAIDVARGALTPVVAAAGRQFVTASSGTAQGSRGARRPSSAGS